MLTNTKYIGDYFPYGKVLREYVNGDKERYLTTQHERDNETGLDYRGARYYDSDVARFLSLDPLASDYPSWSDYCYVAGNPIVFVDPDGKDIILVGTDGTKLASYSSSGVTYFNGGEFTNFVKQFEIARDYLNPHSTLLADVEKSNAILEIQNSTGVEGLGSFTPNSKSPTHVYTDASKTATEVIKGVVIGKIKWDINYALIDGQGNIHSPALILDHEMSHAVHYLLDPLGMAKDKKNKKNMGKMDDKEEENAVKHSNKTSKSLNNGDGGFGTRKDHTGKPSQLDLNENVDSIKLLKFMVRIYDTPPSDNL